MREKKTKNIPTIVCEYCGWEGTEDRLVRYSLSEWHSYQTKYNGAGCPVCESDEYLTDIIDVEKYNEKRN